MVQLFVEFVRVILSIFPKQQRWTEEPGGKKKPLLFRDPKGRMIGWEVYGWNCFFLTIGVKSLEIQINKWRKTS